MGTLTALLNLSQSALEASQTAIDITSTNVANANTPGYTSEVANWQESDTVRLGGGVSSTDGPTVTAVSQRDPILNQRVQQQTQLVSASSAESAALNDLQSVFGLTSTSTVPLSTTIGGDIDGLFSSLNALEAAPSSNPARQAVLSAVMTLTTDFNSAAKQIAQQTEGLNQRVSGQVTQVNSLMTSIAALNLKIESTSPNGDAVTLEDQRQQDLTLLSQYIGFDQTKTENNGLTLTTANGALLVSEGQSYALSAVLSKGTMSIVSASGRDITSGLPGGSLGGMVQARDKDLTQISSSLDKLAYAIGSAVNEQNTVGLDATGKSGGPIFNLPVSPTGTASKISPAVFDPNAIAAAAAGEGATGGSNATALSGLANSRLADGQTASDFYASLLTLLGSSASRVTEQNTTQQASLQQLTTQQGAKSSVSLDEEAANLTLYERSYNAAAKVFTIVDQLMASALNLGIETTVT